MSAYSEDSLQMQVAQYLSAKYPSVIFRSDFAAGIKMTKGQAVKHKRLQAGRAYPDLFIAKPRYIKIKDDKGRPLYHAVNCGLYLELKKDGTELRVKRDGHKIRKGDYKIRKKGDWASLHIEEQANMLESLRTQGYAAQFAIGYDEATQVIDRYMGDTKPSNSF